MCSNIGRGLSTIKPSGAKGLPGEMDMMPGNPNTLNEALGTRGRAMSVTRAVKNANPFFDPAYGDYSENCQRAVVAVEGRFRGYDIIASPTYTDDRASYGGNWMKYFKGAKSIDVGRPTAKDTQRVLESQMRKFGNGSRAIMRITWGDGGGHVINIINRGGKVHYYDGQIGGRYRPKDLFKAIKTEKTQVVRVDNLEFDESAREAVRKNPFRKR